MLVRLPDPTKGTQDQCPVGEKMEASKVCYFPGDAVPEGTAFSSKAKVLLPYTVTPKKRASHGPGYLLSTFIFTVGARDGKLSGPWPQGRVPVRTMLPGYDSLEGGRSTYLPALSNSKHNQVQAGVRCLQPRPALPLVQGTLCLERCHQFVSLPPPSCTEGTRVR